MICGKQMVFGCGMGRCGMRSLTNLLHGQPHTAVQREVYFLPWERNDAALCRVARAMLGWPATFVGGVAPWYLPYAPLLAQAYDARVVVMRAPKDEEVARFMLIRFDHFSAYPPRNNPPCPMWVRALPKFGNEGTPREENTRAAWDYYYAMAADLAYHDPDHVRIMEMGELNSRRAQAAVLHWCGYDAPVPVHTDRRWPLED